MNLTEARARELLKEFGLEEALVNIAIKTASNLVRGYRWTWYRPHVYVSHNQLTGWCRWASYRPHVYVSYNPRTRSFIVVRAPKGGAS